MVVVWWCGGVAFRMWGDGVGEVGSVCHRRPPTRRPHPRLGRLAALFTHRHQSPPHRLTTPSHTHNTITPHPKRNTTTPPHHHHATTTPPPPLTTRCSLCPVGRFVWLGGGVWAGPAVVRPTCSWCGRRAG
ncbi:hypothetical protein I4F81_001434 [Pyropia yezoensis]|uniref:Uncharacterized protein n=1 Tax=Pyropia yezoensis TaxID=2788 RepID=A0ACC3BM68_PYRYE|nr:hypothetical protein I4F81_001434 [Neopyropia yezoensis]